ncbi:hypothetical protein [Neisseria animalis]|uniref:hypothetical protein n=1 Tax=Neisseria animalis TaxID=492 RepID=UPI000F511FE3|nr:hypothetical protein [Neisseria animalis]
MNYPFLFLMETGLIFTEVETFVQREYGQSGSGTILSGAIKRRSDYLFGIKCSRKNSRLKHRFADGFCFGVWR